MNMHHLLRKVSNKFSCTIPFLLIICFSLPFNKDSYAQEDDPVKMFQVCGVCHSIGKGKLIGPDLYKVTERRDRDWLIRFIRNSEEVIQSGDEYAIKLFEEYNKVTMPPVTYTDEQINLLIDYIANYDPAQAVVATAPAAPVAPVEIDGKPYVFMSESHHPWAYYRLAFFVSLLLLVLSLVDLIFLKFIKAKFFHISIILITLTIISGITVKEAQALGRQQYYEPDQPIAFSHYIHAGQNQIDCQYCHSTATISKSAGFPSPQLCLNCHNVIQKGTYSGTAEIAKISQSISSGKSIEWIRVHNLPDHVYFNHAQHFKTGKMDCTECHGEVEKMDRVRQVHDLGMGWCIECHRTQQVQFLENEFYAAYKQLHEDLKTNDKTFVSVDDVGGTNCARCHY
ncbi:MAG TPA: c-type cytochrome [Bacteroidales bacterium]|nr:c-type cytochrome [Bacteroidales bacterium]